ncbi:mercuric resistance operon regulatory protein [Hyphomonas johnsonii MHS-2]|uniref:Mercuric resistance operon regulatory protein n=1 Tax=Hyphomonas johnsonii MHS-2 TaxID=1280950 RepID=A0A059FSN9_9PROT|nr:mercuric resistance operon regulatory protein [Hyphomonas johnsonii MHS-2]
MRFVLRSRELGFTIEEIRSLLSLVDDGDYSCAEIHALTTNHLKSVSRKIADLRRLERTLKRISGECAKGNEPDCPIIDALAGAANQ